MTLIVFHYLSAHLELLCNCATETRDLVKHTAAVKTAFRRAVGNLTGNGIKCANYRTGVKVAGKRFHVGSCLSYRCFFFLSVLLKMFPCPTWKRDVTPACFSDPFCGSKSASDFCFRTGAVGLPLPGVEVRIALNNAAHTTIVEGNQKDTQVNDEYWCCLNQVIFLFPFFLFSFHHLILVSHSEQFCYLDASDRKTNVPHGGLSQDCDCCLYRRCQVICVRQIELLRSLVAKKQSYISE